ncbi:MAG TPA: L,D-transpeptidase [Candidatus Obscuribacterales bacterium]
MLTKHTSLTILCLAAASCSAAFATVGGGSASHATATSKPTATTNKSSNQPEESNSKTEGSFINGKYEIGKDVTKNGYHKGEPVVIVVDKGSHYTYVFQLQNNDKVAEVYRASNAVGKDDTPTPYGPYKVADKVKWPSWIPPKSIDPKQKAVQPYNKTHKNPLGVARIGLNKFGINLHGTNDPHSLRHDVSHGCIRHSNKDIMKIFNMVKVGDTVIIAKNLVGTTLTKDEFTGKHKK